MLSLAELSDTAKAFGFRAEGYKIDKSVFEKLSFPVIAKIEREENYPHFVVVANQEGDFVSILDPNYGRYIIAKNEFYELWEKSQKGYILVLMPEKVASFPTIPLNLPNRTLFVR
jgi:predicted double-glycine peptidase